MSKSRGFTFIELLVVLAIVGTLFGIVTSNLPRGNIELRQAAQSFSLSVSKARSEAIRNNKFAGITFTTTSFSVFVDENNNRTYDDSLTDTIISTVDLGADYPSLTVTKSSSNEIVFEPRGFVWGAVNQTIVFSSSKSSSIMNATIGLQGQVKIEKITN